MLFINSLYEKSISLISQTSLWHDVGYDVVTKTKNIMKASTNTTVILKALDLELKALLQKDLAQFKAERNQATQQTAATKRAA